MNKIFYPIFVISFLMFASSIKAQEAECTIFELLPPVVNFQPAVNDPTEPCGFEVPGSGLYINQCSPCGRKISDDNCVDTPNPTICELDGFQTTTSGFSEDVDPLGVGFCGGAGSIENNFWVGFTAQTNLLTLRMTIDECSGTQGIQIAIVETDCENTFTQMTGPNPCNANGLFNNADIFTVTNLVPGNPYYIMFDGFAGDVCEILIEVLDGFDTPEFDTVVIPPGELCPDVTNPGGYTAQAGSGGQVVVTTGGIATTDLTFYWLDPNGNLIATTDPDMVDGNQVFGSLDGSFFNEVGVYTVEIIDNGSCCPLCTSVDLVIADPPAAAAAIILGANGEAELNCNNETVLLDGNPDDGSVPAIESWTIVDFLGNRQVLSSNFVSTAGRIGQFPLTRDDIIDHYPGQEEGIATLVYGFLQDLDQTCFGDAAIEVPFDFRTPDIDIDTPDEIDCDLNPTVELNASNTNTYNHNATYAWTYQDGTTTGIASGGDTDRPEVALNGFYTLVVTDLVNGCVDSMQVEVMGMVDPPTLTAIPDTMINCINNQSIDVSSVGDAGGAPIIYSWEGPDGNIIVGEINPSLTVSEVGSYTLTARNTTNQCVAFTSFTVGDGIPVLAIDAFPMDTITCTDQTVTFPTAVVNGGAGDYTYSWTDSSNDEVSTTADLTATVDGVYTLTVTDVASGCTEVQTATVMMDQDAPEVDALTDIELTCTTTMQSATANAVDPNGAAIMGIQYEWFDDMMMSVGTDAAFDFDAEGTYTVVATNPNNGCVSDAGTIIITVNDTPPAASIDMPGVIGCGASSTVTLMGEPATGDYTYQWYEGDATGTALGTAATQDVTVAGDYTLVVTDILNGCSSAPVTVSVTANNTVPTPIIATPEVLDCTKLDNGDGVDLDASGTVGTNLSYAWTGPSPANTSAGGDAAVITVTLAGDYTLVVTDNTNGCVSDPEIVTVLEDTDAPEGVTATGGTIVCGAMNVTNTVTLMGNSTTSPVSYIWTDIGTIEYPGQNPEVSSAGEFTLTVTNTDNGCTETATATVINDSNVPTILWEQIAGDELAPISCKNPIKEYRGFSPDNNPDITFTWFDPNNTEIPGNPIVLDENSLEGNYTIVGTDANSGCAGDSGFNLSFNFYEPEIVLTGGTIFCDPNDAVTLSAEDIGADAAQTSFTWSNDTGSFTEGLSNPTVTEPGMYTVVAINNGSGCTTEGMVEVFANNENPTVSAAPNTSLTCFTGGDSYDLMGAGSAANGTDAVTYSWAFNNAGEISTDPNFIATEAGTYILTVTNTVSNCTETATVIIDDARDEPLGTANFADGNTVLNCINPMVLLTGASDLTDVTYQWTSAGGTIIDEQNPTVTESGLWTLIVTSTTTGCSSVPSSVDVMEDFAAPENVMITGDNEITCDPGFVQMFGTTSTMNVTYAWTVDNDATYMSSEANPTVFETGLYTLTVTGTNGCFTTATFAVTRDEGVPVAGAMADGILTCDNMSVMVSGTSSAMNSSYEWSGPGTFIPTNTQDIEVTLPGDYTLSIVDLDNGCPGSATVTVDINEDPPVVTTMGTTVNCDQTEIFTISAEAAMVANAEFAWSGPVGFMSTESNPVITEAGDYTVTVTDPANGCPTIEDVLVMDDRELPDDLMIQEDIMILTCANDMSTITASSATPGDYTWTGGTITGATGPSITVTEPGSYEVVFTDPVNGCSITLGPVVIDQDITPPMIVEQTPLILDCQRMEVALAVTANEEITYEWSDDLGTPLAAGATDASPMVSEPGAYNVVVTALDNGCTAMLTIQVEQDMDIPLSIPATTELTCEFPEVTLDGTASTAGPSITYNWANDQGVSISTEMSTTATEPGEYTLTVINSDNECRIDSTITLDIDDTPPTADAGMDDVFPCGVTSVNLSGSGTGQGALSYIWTNSTGAILGEEANVEVTQSGTFTLTVIDSDNGCLATDDVMITPDENKPVIVTEPIEELTCNVTSVELSAINTTGQGNLSFTWTFDENGMEAGTGATINVTSPGQYTVQVFDDSNGCDDSRTVMVTQNIDTPTFDVTGGEIDCLAGFSSVRITNLSTAATFAWEGPGEFTSMDQDLENITVAGVYSVTVTASNNGCTAIGTGTVTASVETPNVSIAAADELDCETEEVQLIGEADAGFSYSWSGPNILSGGNTLTPIVGEAGEYILTVTNPANGCPGIAPITVTENTNVITDIAPEGGDVNCFGPNTGSISVNQSQVTGGTAPYVYSVDGGENFSTQEEFLGLTAGMYDVVVMDANGCEFDLPITINPADELVLDLGENQVITFGDSITLDPQANFDIDAFVWSDTTLLIEEPWVKPLNTTSYEIVAFDEDGCITTDNITVFVEKTRPVYIPNAFSPGTDGINDFFTVYADLGLITTMTNFSVYDRWGAKLHEIEEMNPVEALTSDFGWDGMHRGEEMSPGVYVYHVLVEFIDGEKIFYEGNFTLMR